MRHRRVLSDPDRPYRVAIAVGVGVLVAVVLVVVVLGVAYGVT